MNTARFNTDSHRLAEIALREALQLGHTHVAPEHLLLALIRLASKGESNAATRALARTCGVDQLRSAVISELNSAMQKATLWTFKDKPAEPPSRINALKLAIDNASEDADPAAVIAAAVAYEKYLSDESDRSEPEASA